MDAGRGLVGIGATFGACLYGPYPQIAAWLNEAIGEARGGGGALTAIGAVHRGEVRGAIGFSAHREQHGDVGIHAAFLPGCPFRDCSIQAHRYAFDQLEVHRITAVTVGSNAEAQRFIEWHGYVREGTMRKAWLGREDLIVYRMTRRLWKRRGLDSGREYPGRRAVWRQTDDGRIEVRV